ncbi:hypothetical protein GUJ93_ZPchr0458g22481 [Zizania palustris]|uniref:Uncharacterized protein n=1 Tax=Zizania palustris TaxID=103762 RepID=A0A8J5RKI1_ZIZPA|nr:hypothetical protein GUJ93_ZPchr0119g33236 [Zizania palustris]KAG8043610.1 hypothetical protein GUJ93_ZPchr0458g22481 [Zizania palustris]
MSLRYVSRVGARAAQAVRESAGRSVKDKAQSAATATTSSSSAMARSRAPAAAGSVDSGRVSAVAAARRAAEEKRKREEQSLRTVMFLSVWGPNT